ncbi:helix-turn-helix domain-containing protein [Paenibacillus sp. EPM92]|uniref:response regulator transcription factor n=1 Tax=Paenibacillus sp. EPM92 TaxID=1561195 RepID=UPI001916170F|nr:helix-turn-helix domain-containing protein [Paenibacillus sp. EPM92]
MKICVADDEKEVRLSIIHKLKTVYPAAQIFDVEFGRQALEQILVVQPDLVFLDIRMPEMDGLDILRALKQEKAHIRVVILSGYDDFDYARRALQLGATDYLLKPADRDQLREVVTKVKQEMEAAFLKEFDLYLGHLSSLYLFIHDLRCLNTSLWFDEREAKDIHLGDTGELLKRWERSPERILIAFSVNHDYGGIVVSASSVPGEHRFQAKRDFLPVVQNAIEAWESRRFFGASQPSPESRRKDRKDAGKQAAGLRQKILSFAKEGHYPNLETALEAWLNTLLDLDLNQLKKECVNLMALLDEGLSKSDMIVIEDEKLHYWSQWVAKHKTWDELKSRIRKFVLDGVRALMHLEHQSGLSWFDQALHMVDTSRDPNLSLESIADVVGVHPVTLSRIFKQQTGMNFVRYLVRSRLQHAQSLLLKTDKKINEISEEVGYVDYRYFRTLFKKEFGCTPSEYRRRNGIGAAGDEADS